MVSASRLVVLMDRILRPGTAKKVRGSDLFGGECCRFAEGVIRLDCC